MVTYRVKLRRTIREPWTAQTRTGTYQRAREIAAFYQSKGFQVAVVQEGGKKKITVPRRKVGSP